MRDAIVINVDAVLEASVEEAAQRLEDGAEVFAVRDGGCVLLCWRSGLGRGQPGWRGVDARAALRAAGLSDQRIDDVLGAMAVVDRRPTRFALFGAAGRPEGGRRWRHVKVGREAVAA